MSNESLFCVKEGRLGSWNGAIYIRISIRKKEGFGYTSISCLILCCLAWWGRIGGIFGQAQ